VIANGHRITFDRVFIATHVPLQGNAGTVGAALFQTKLASYSTYAIAARYPKNSIDEMIWSDTADPFNYFRVDRTDDGDIVVLGGEDHKTGQTIETGDCFAALENTLRRYFGDHGEVTHRWSGQVVETIDGLPFIGETAEGQFIATGFSGNGMTLGTIAALMARDKFTNVENPFEKVFDPGRRKLAAAGTYLSENKDFPYRMVKDRLNIPNGEPGAIAPGEGCVLKADGETIAACRDANGVLHQLSAVCPHMGCIVAWNEGEHTWDCPCHGSRFHADGKLIAGPAEQDLQPIT
jgi:Rieske Fe-S protein